MIKENYKQQVKLLLRVLPEVARESCFALHGGTAINLFIRDMPRLSVDIDLTYTHIEARDQTLEKISSSLSNICQGIRRSIKNCRVEHKLDKCKLIISQNNLEVKVEVNIVARGVLGKVEKSVLTNKTSEEFNAFVEIQTLPIGQLYGGKICAALDRQHPRDLFDVKYLLDNDILDRKIVDGLLLALISNDRPIHEVLNPHFLDQKKAMENQFSGMTDQEFTYIDFEQTRQKLVDSIKLKLKAEDKKFLLDFNKLQPNWNIHDFRMFPAVQWKLKNLEIFSKTDHTKYLTQCNLLEKWLEVE